MAAIKPCGIAGGPDNTGFECGTSLAAPKLNILVPANAEWDDDDLENFYDYIVNKLHAPVASRWYMINAKIKNIENNEEADTMETFPDGSQVFVKYGNYNRMFHMNAGGICLGQSLMSFNKKGYHFIEVDIEGKIGFKRKPNGKYGGFAPDELYSPKPKLADFTTSYMNKLFISISPIEYIKNAEIRVMEEDLTTLQGLVDVKVESRGAATTTKLTVGAVTLCVGTDLYETYGADLAKTTAWVIKNKDTGAVITASAAAANASEKGYDLTVATQASTTVLTVGLAAADVLAGLTPAITGHEGKVVAEITIP